MAWIKMRTDLHENPHVIRLATLLAIPRLHVLGLVCRFWAWADTNTPDGRDCLEELHADDLDRIVEHPEFAAAMESVGWLIVTETGIEIPDFDLHMSQSAKKRAVDARRQAVSRIRRDKKRTHVGQKCDQIREEKIREDKKQNNKGIESTEFVATVLGNTGPIPDTFVAAWSEWVAHRTEIKKPLTERAARKQLKTCKEIGYERAIKAIEHSIAGGYQGLFEPGRSGRPRHLGSPDIPKGKYADG